MGYLYLLHYHAPLSGKRASHYLGYAGSNPQQRIQEHATGTGRAVFTTEAHRQGITFEIGGLWPNKTKNDERRLKRQRNHRRYCVICRPGGIAVVMPHERPQIHTNSTATSTSDDIDDLPH